MNNLNRFAEITTKKPCLHLARHLSLAIPAPHTAVLSLPEIKVLFFFGDADVDVDAIRIMLCRFLEVNG